jgi:multidrug efflux system membrane fusion protein
MKIRIGVVLAWVLTLSVTAWIWSGVFLRGEIAPEVGASAPTALLPRVQTEIMHAESVIQYLTLNAQTAAKRSITVKSETGGKVLKVPFAKGERVERGDLLARLDTTDLPARIAASKALEKQRLQEYLSTEKLVKQGFQNASQSAASLAQLEQAKAQTLGLEYQLAYTDIRAPFDGVINRSLVEAGSVIRNGDPVVELVDFSTLKVITDVSENDIAYIAIGQTASIELVQGEQLVGIATYIDTMANAATRTFSVEFEINQPVDRPLAGASAVVKLPLKPKFAHFVSPALLILDDDGELGLKALSDDGFVMFHNIDIIESTPQGIWVAGLPERVHLITVGQGFVTTGQKAVAVAGAKPAQSR